MFGETPHPDVSGWICPQIIFTPVSGGIRLEKTTAEIRRLSSKILKIGDYLLGKEFTATMTRVTSPEGKVYPLKKQIATKDLVVDKLEVFFKITPEAREAIIMNETDHLKDYEQAFTLSFKRVADAINQLAGVYTSQEEAIRKLIQELQGNAPQLIPWNPTTLTLWEPRLRAVASQLCAQTDKRDKEGDHLPDGFRAIIEGGSKIYLIPESKKLHRPPESIINLAKIPVVFDSATMLQAAPLQTGGTAKLKEKYKVSLYPTEADARKKTTSKEIPFRTIPLEANINAQTTVTIVALMESSSQPTKALVSLGKQKQSGIDTDVFGFYETPTFFFEVNADQLMGIS